MPSTNTDAAEVLHGTQVLLRRTTEDDVDALAAILAEPGVQRWWGRYNADRIRAEMIDVEGTIVYTIEVDGEVAGSIQYSEEPSPDYRHAGIDIFLSVANHGRGLGTDAIRTVARHLIHDRGHHRLVIDPAADNVAAITCYERVGFRRVGLMRQYERGIDGSWHDGLMLEALRGDLI